MLPLPVPRRGGSIEELASCLNLPGPNDFVLVVAWLLATLRAGGPYPVLATSGEQGSAKAVLSKLLKDLVDPSATITMLGQDRHGAPPSTPRIWASGQFRKSLPSTPVRGFIRAIRLDNLCRIRSKSGRDRRWDIGLLAMDPTK